MFESPLHLGQHLFRPNYSGGQAMQNETLSHFQSKSYSYFTTFSSKSSEFNIDWNSCQKKHKLILLMSPLTQLVLKGHNNLLLAQYYIYCIL